MNRFRYALDPLALLAVAAYATNRWVLKPHVGAGFWHDHFNDLWLIPAALPLVLWLQRRLGWRNHDRPPTWSEIGFHFAVWALICEGVGPYFVAHATADWNDVIAYLVGAVVAGSWWGRSSAPRATTTPEAVPAAKRR